VIGTFSLTFSDSFSQSVEKLTVQSQLNDKFARIVFKSPDIEKFNVNLQKETVELDFGMPIKASFDRILTNLSQYLKKAEISKSGKSVILQFRDSYFDVRKFKSSKFAGIDILFRPKPAIAIKKSKKTIGSNSTKSISSLIKQIFGDNVPTPKIKPITKEVFGPPIPPVDIARYRIPIIKPKSINVVMSDEFIGPHTKEDFDARVAVAFQLPPPPPKPGDDWEGEKALTWEEDPETIALEHEEEEKDVVAIQEAEPEPIPVIIEEPEITKEPDPEPETLATESEDKFTLTAKVKKIDKGIKLVFPFTKRTAAAAYNRGGYLWLVFDRYEVIDLNKILKNKYIKEAEQIFHKDFSILRLNIEHKKYKELNIQTQLDNAQWLVKITQGEQQPVELSVKVNLDIDGIIPKAFIPIEKTGKTLKMLDPIVGDKIVVIPVFREKLGVTPVRNFVDFTMIESLQGLVISLKSDKTVVRGRSNGTVITKTAGLNLYSGAVKDLKYKQKLALIRQKSVQAFSLFPFNSNKYNEEVGDLLKTIDEADIVDEDSEEGTEEENAVAKKEDEEKISTDTELTEELDGKEFYKIRNELLDNIINANTDKEKTARRLTLARFYFSNKLYAESLGVLQSELKEHPDKKHPASIMPILAASNYMMGHYKEASAMFKDLAKTLTLEEGLEEIQLWWWASNFQIRPKSLQTTEDIPLKYYQNLEYFLSEYPPKLRQNIGLLAAEYNIQKENFDDAKAILQAVAGEEVPHNIKNSIQFLEASILEKEDFVDDAIAIWKDLSEDIDDRYNRARSTFAMNKLMYTLDREDKKETIEKLDKLRIVWKGDDFELDLLKFLGGLYIFERDFINGLRTWRELVTEFPKTQEALLIARQMKKTFIDLFDKGVAYELNPFDALTLYFEFRELTPVGETGDRIIRQLVDHFVKADLLENAAALLTHQVRFRSTGKQRVDLATKLAEIHLTNKRPDLTLQALDFIKDNDMSQEMREKNKYIRAHALIQLKKYHDTLRLLANDWSKDAQTLRLEIFLEQQNWFGIMNITEPRLAEIIDRGDPIKGDSLKDLLLLSISYATQQEHDKLESLQSEFIDKIEDQNGRRVFAFITNDKGAIDHMNFDSTVQLEDISGFVANYLFWPSRKWASVIDVLEPEINSQTFIKKTTLTQDEMNQVVQLAIAYAMESKTTDDPKQTKMADKGLKRLQRQFSKVQIDERTLPIFISLTQDPDLIPDSALKTPVPLKNIEQFVNDYNDMLMGGQSVL
jgi:predicted negative regulator of RcsB-dependent stress response